MSTLDVLERWEEFSDLIMQRLAIGDAEYHDDPADSKSTTVLLREIEEEMLDIPAWMLFMWQRLNLVRENIEELEKRAAHLAKTTPIPRR
jgi:hypothetical protein